MTTSRTVPGKIPLNLYKKLKETQAARIKNDVDKEASSMRRIMEGIARHEQLWKDLSIAKWIEDNRGQTSFNIFTFMIVGFIAVVLFGGLIYVSGILNTTFHGIGLTNEVNSGVPGYTNLTLAADQTFGAMDSSIQGLRLVALTMIFALIIGTIVTNSLVRIHPAFFFPYMLIVILAVMFAAPLSNSYESLLQQGIYGGLLDSFTGSGWVLLNLPLVTGIVGVLGGIFLFINIIRAGNEDRTI